jgi:hypothetical protein
MASMFGEQEKEAGTTRSPTPDTLVEENRNVGNISDKQLEAAGENAKAEEVTLGVDGGLDMQEKQEEAAVEEDDVEYASGIKLAFIVIALALSIFLVSLLFTP